MRRGVVTAVCVSCLSVPGLVLAQAPASPAALTAPHAASFWAPFREIPADLKGFVSRDGWTILAPAAIGAAIGSQFDQEGITMALARFRPAGAFTMGNVGGGFYAQTGGALAVYTLGHFTRSDTVRAVGSDLVRAQILTQLTVQTAKYVLRRERPDDSDHMSLPSGHSAGTFATATVLQRHFGWKVGVPAYAAGAYVAASRMSANKHHLSDVLMGAAFGVVAGRTVTVGAAGQRFSVDVAPTPGGATVTLTRQ